jgi:hypothetical protein
MSLLGYAYGEAPAMFQVGQQVIDQQKQALAPDPGPVPYPGAARCCAQTTRKPEVGVGNTVRGGGRGRPGDDHDLGCTSAAALPLAVETTI